MTNVRYESIEDYNDIETLNMYKERLSMGYDEVEIMNSIYAKGRDNARTPMQWSKEKNGGFTKATPWLKVNENYKYINVEQCLEDEYSIFYYYKKLINLRKNYDVIKYGNYNLILEDHPEVYSYTRNYKNEELLIICNFYENTIKLKLPSEYHDKKAYVLISNYKECSVLSENIVLRPYEAIVYKII